MGNSERAPQVRTGTPDDAGRNCPYCRFALKQGAEVAVCGACGAPHHLECWTDNGGCAVIACAGGPGAAVPTEPTMPRVPTPPPTAGLDDQRFSPGVPVGSGTAARAASVAPPPPPGGATPPKARRGPTLTVAVLTLALAVGSAAAVLLATRSQGGATTTISTAVPPATTVTAPVTVTQPPTTRTVTETVPVSTPSTPPTSDTAPTSDQTSVVSGFPGWPAGYDGYTVALASDIYQAHAIMAATQAQAAGLPRVGIVRSSAFSSLRPGYWFVFTGVYATAAAAAAHVGAARGVTGFADAYPTRVAP